MRLKHMWGFNELLRVLEMFSYNKLTVKITYNEGYKHRFLEWYRRNTEPRISRFRKISFQYKVGARSREKA